MNPQHGGLAQLGEHLPCTQGVKSSSLLISTITEDLMSSVFINGLIAQSVRAHA
jgi:hypothetical protein